jgi:hypothetical protein
MKLATGSSVTLSLKSSLGSDQWWDLSRLQSSHLNCSDTGTLSSSIVCSLALMKHLDTSMSRRLVADTRMHARSTSLEMCMVVLHYTSPPCLHHLIAVSPPTPCHTTLASSSFGATASSSPCAPILLLTSVTIRVCASSSSYDQCS